MLLRYGTENHRSIYEYQEISCAASAKLDDDDAHLIRIDEKGLKGDFLPIVALYGANAAGKSNMVDALEFMVWCIRVSARNSPDTDSIVVRPSKIKNASAERASLYDCDVLIDSVRYHYGFTCVKEGFVREWLHSFPNGLKTVLFERDFQNPESIEIKFGSSLGKVDKTLRDVATNRKALFLSLSRQTKHEILLPIQRYFATNFEFIDTQNTSVSEESVARGIEDPLTRKTLERFLKEADIGFISLEVERNPVSESSKQLSKELFKVIKQFTQDDVPDFSEREEDIEINFLHQCEDGTRFKVPLSDESTGTRHLLLLLIPVLDAIRKGRTLVVDEITTTLHTKLSRELLSLFSNREENSKRAQFIFTTHDTNLLSRDVLRRDEVWFAERDRLGKTSIYPLSDFKTRKTDNVEKGYLQGRFGAVPFLGNLQKLIDEV